MARLTDMVKTKTEEFVNEMSMMKCEDCGHKFEGEDGDDCPECGHSETMMMEEDETTEKDALIEALKTLIEMVKEDALIEDELEILDDAIDFISEDFEDAEDFDEQLDEAQKLNKMSAKDKAKARKYRMKNKGKLKIQSKKRKMKLKKFGAKRKACAIKIAGKEGYACNSKGKIYRKKERK